MKLFFLGWRGRDNWRLEICGDGDWSVLFDHFHSIHSHHHNRCPTFSTSYHRWIRLKIHEPNLFLHKTCYYPKVGQNTQHPYIWVQTPPCCNLVKTNFIKRSRYGCLSLVQCWKHVRFYWNGASYKGLQ